MSQSHAADASSSGSLIHELGRTLDAANAYLEALMAHEGVTGLVPSHGDILSALFEAEPASMQQLAEACGRDPSTVTALVKKLVSAGYVAVERCPNDGRSRWVTLTDEGRALRPKFERISARLREAQSQGVTPAELAEVQRVLGIIRSTFGKES